MCRCGLEYQDQNKPVAWWNFWLHFLHNENKILNRQKPVNFISYISYIIIQSVSQSVSHPVSQSVIFLRHCNAMYDLQAAIDKSLLHRVSVYNGWGLNVTSFLCHPCFWGSPVFFKCLVPAGNNASSISFRFIGGGAADRPGILQ